MDWYERPVTDPTISLRAFGIGRKGKGLFPSRKEFYRRKRRVISRGRSVCGRGTGRRGELRLAKLSLAVSDSFLSNGTGGKERGGKQGDGGSWVPQGSLPWSPQGSPDPSTAADFQFFFELHATSSRSNSLLRPPPPPPLSLFLSLSALSSSCFPSSLPFFLLLRSSFVFPVCPSQAMRRGYERTSRGELGEPGPRIDLMRIIPALIAKTQRMVQAVLV